MSHLEGFEYEGSDDINADIDGISGDDWDLVAEGPFSVEGVIGGFFNRISRDFSNTFEDIQSNPMAGDIADAYQYALDRFNDGYNDFLYLFDTYGGAIVEALRPHAMDLMRCRSMEDFREVLSSAYEELAPGQVRDAISDAIEIVNSLIGYVGELRDLAREYRDREEA